MTGTTFIDLSKAFDTLRHSQIIETLGSCGVTGNLVGRKQSVRIQNVISAPQRITCGVPQGSMLRPLLFLVTFNDIGTFLKHSEIITYADSTVIYVEGTSIDCIQKKLQEDFNAVSIDPITNFKKGKTECMLFGTAQKVKNKSIEICNKSNQISNMKSYKCHVCSECTLVQSIRIMFVCLFT